MKTLTIVGQKTNPALGRTEVHFEFSHEKASTPKRSDVKRELTNKLNVDSKLLQLMKIETKTNTWKTVGLAHIYSSPERAKLLTPKYLIARELPKEEKAKRKEKKAAPKPAAPPKKK